MMGAFSTEMALSIVFEEVQSFADIDHIAVYEPSTYRAHQSALTLNNPNASLFHSIDWTATLDFLGNTIIRE
jgi:hypothetical protein